MDNYNWQKNKALVDRCYYTERIFETTFFFAAAYTATNMLYIRKGYFANTCSSRLLPVWGYFAAFNAVMAFIMLKPLTQEELRS